MSDSRNDRAKEALEIAAGTAADGDPLALGLDLADALDAGILDDDWIAGSDVLSEIHGDMPASDDSDGDGGDDDGGDESTDDSFVFDDTGADVLDVVLDATGTSDGVGGLSEPAHSTFGDSDAGGHGRSGALGSGNGNSDSAPRFGEDAPASFGFGSSSASSDATSHGTHAGGVGRFAVGDGDYGTDHFAAFLEGKAAFLEVKKAQDDDYDDVFDDDILDDADDDGDILTGTPGDDTFIFKTGDGQDTIKNFEAGDSDGDLIDLRQLTAAASFTGVMAAAAQIGVDTFIDFGGGDTLTLEDVLLDDLNAGDFLF